MPPESTSPVLEIRIDDLRGPEVAALLREHLDEMAQYSPPESRHALDLEGLRHPAVVFWTAWENGSLVGCAALKRLDDGHAEIKSMRTAVAHQRRGIAGRLLEHVIAEVRRRGFRRLSLETGAMPAFDRARRLYAKFGFQPCEPFAAYRPDRNSVFMTLEL